MTTFDTGRKAEQAAAEYLRKRGYEILAQNWKTRTCEIDIVARRDAAVYVVEVKYRHSAGQGTGLEYVTTKKLRQMQFAAETWVHEHNWVGDYRLAALEVSGPSFQVTNFLDDIIL